MAAKENPLNIDTIFQGKYFILLLILTKKKSLFYPTKFYDSNFH